MAEQKRWLAQQWEDFQTGGGLKTAARRFLQTAPLVTPLTAGIGFVGGEILPGLPDLVAPTSPNQVMIAKEYGPEWMGPAAGIGFALSAAEAVSFPFRIGARIREGELEEIPPIPHIGIWVQEGIRRGIDHVRHFRRDFSEGGGRREWLHNLPLPSIAGVGGGASVGMVAEMIANASSYQSSDPLLAGIIGGGIGLTLGVLGAAEIVAHEGRMDRRERENPLLPLEYFYSRPDMQPSEDEDTPRNH